MSPCPRAIAPIPPSLPEPHAVPAAAALAVFTGAVPPALSEPPPTPPHGLTPAESMPKKKRQPTGFRDVPTSAKSGMTSAPAQPIARLEAMTWPAHRFAVSENLFWHDLARITGLWSGAGPESLREDYSVRQCHICTCKQQLARATQTLLRRKSALFQAIID